MIALQNRLNNASARGIVPVRLLIVLIILPALFLTCLSLDSRCKALGRELKTLEAEIDDLNRECRNEESVWMRMKSPGEIEKALKRFRLEMGWPDDSQVVRLSMRDFDAEEIRGVPARHAHYAQAGRMR